MGRVHLFEWHDLQWFPRVLRWLITETLRFIWCDVPSRGQCQALAAAGVFRSITAETGATNILDMCSGCGGPMPVVAAELAKHPQSSRCIVTLSDLYPPTDTWAVAAAATPDNLRFVSEPVDATAVPPALRPPGTVLSFMFCFHHFDHPAAEKLIRDCVRNRNTLVIIEGTVRSPAGVVFITIASLLATVLLWPLMPFSFSRLFFTFCCPLLPLALIWDGVVSCLRTYSQEEYTTLVARCGDDAKGSYTWRYSEVNLTPVAWLPMPRLFVFTGVPKQKVTHSRRH